LLEARACANFPLLTGSNPSAEMGTAHRLCKNIINLTSCPNFADNRAQLEERLWQQ